MRRVTIRGDQRIRSASITGWRESQGREGHTLGEQLKGGGTTNGAWGVERSHEGEGTWFEDSRRGVNRKWEGQARTRR